MTEAIWTTNAFHIAAITARLQPYDFCHGRPPLPKEHMGVKSQYTIRVQCQTEVDICVCGSFRRLVCEEQHLCI
uniref:Uncharacterized protein n=1 Tax=Setaria italica TaxID=4555 RepID=K3ZFS8_SETIT